MMKNTIKSGKCNRTELSKRQMTELHGGSKGPKGRPTEESGDPRLGFMVWIGAVGFGLSIYNFVSDMGDCD